MSARRELWKRSETTTIVRRRGGRRGGEEQVSGAWKVAFADFTLAMMALFMVLWIVQPQGKPRESLYPESATDSVLEGGAGVFDSSSRTPLDLEGVQPVVIRDPSLLTEWDADWEGRRRFFDSVTELQELAALVRQMAEEADALANIEIDIVPQGLRILIKDDDERYMFERGSAVLDPHFERLLQALAGILRRVENKLILSGHTDSTPYRHTSGYDNWNLSGDRALRARSVMVQAGLPRDSILQVAAQADVMPLRPEDPEHGANRRVEILLLTRNAERLYRELFGETYLQVHYSRAGAELRSGDGA